MPNLRKPRQVLDSMGVCVNAYVLIYVNAYMPPRLYNQVLNKGQKSPKANYAFRKKNLEEKKCLVGLGKIFPLPEIWKKYKKTLSSLLKFSD
jgi:hypothetical protein